MRAAQRDEDAVFINGAWRKERLMRANSPSLVLRGAKTDEF